MLQEADSTGTAVAKTELVERKNLINKYKCQSLFSQHYNVVSAVHRVEARLVLGSVQAAVLIFRTDRVCA